MKKGDKVIIVLNLASPKRPNEYKFKLKEKVIILKVKDEGYIVTDGEKESFVIEAEITPEICYLTEKELRTIVDSLWMVTSIKMPQKNIDEFLQLSSKLSKVYNAKIETIKLDTKSMRWYIKEIADDLKAKKKLTKEHRELAKKLDIVL